MAPRFTPVIVEFGSMMCIKDFCVLVSFSQCDNAYIERCQASFGPKKLVCIGLRALRAMAGLHGQIHSLQHSCSPYDIYTTCHCNLRIISTYSNSHTKEKSITQARKPVLANTGVNRGAMWRFHSCRRPCTTCTQGQCLAASTPRGLASCPLVVSSRSQRLLPYAVRPQ
jgi:hypothetical protein